MKKIFAILAFGALFTTAKAQTKFNAGLELGMPMGDLNTSNGMGFGASFKAFFPMGGDKNALTASIGYMTFSGKTYDLGGFGSITGPSLGVIPIKAGYKLGFDGGFYAEPQIGFSIWSGGASSLSGLTYAPAVGYETGNLDFSIRYEGSSVSSEGVSQSLSFLGLRAAYSFGGK